MESKVSIVAAVCAMEILIMDFQYFTLHLLCCIQYLLSFPFVLGQVGSKLKEVAADFLFILLATGIMFICCRVASSRSSHLKLVNSVFEVNEYLSGL